MEKMERVKFLILAGIILGINSYFDTQDELREQQHYCEMVALWQEYGHLLEADRPGWPPYKGEEMCNGDR